MLVHCLRTAKATIVSHPTFPDIRVEAEFEFESAKSELLKTGCFFPKFPVKATLRDVHLSTQIAEEKSQCTKQYKSTGRLGAGLMLLWCVKHRECLGFTVLLKGESCKELYDILSTRFTQMPRVVIYDNACNLFEVFSHSP